MIKKNLAILLVLTMFVSCLIISPVSATEPVQSDLKKVVSEEVVFETNEIKDINMLKERIKNKVDENKKLKSNLVTQSELPNKVNEKERFCNKPERPTVHNPKIKNY